MSRGQVRRQGSGAIGDETDVQKKGGRSRGRTPEKVRGQRSRAGDEGMIDLG